MSENPSAAQAAPTQVETVIIGAGPVGLFQIFELGLLGISTHIIDSLAQPGGQCTELYPDKPIYDIPALPICGAQELIDRLLAQAKPFHATFHLGQEVTEVRVLEGGKFHVATSGGTRLIAGAVVIAGGVGSFQPRRLGLPGVEAFEGSSVHYRVKSAADFHGRDLLICGGGDSALDWTVALCGQARSLTLLHRRAEFRAAPATVARMRELVGAGKMQVLEGQAAGLRTDDGKLVGLDVHTADGRDLQIGADRILAFYGLHPKLGPIAEWGLELEKRALKVDTEKFQTSVPGIFAIGDINTYPGKKKLILSGFHEAALTAFAIQHHLFPEKRQFLQYTTTSPIMQKRLGVAGAEPDSQSGGI
ncbi:MAG: NAD(P)/FAD-dependent oxidoreductase [Steroidobacteraceae bacterium]